jgi:hypothetical protein
VVRAENLVHDAQHRVDAGHTPHDLGRPAQRGPGPFVLVFVFWQQTRFDVAGYRDG